MRRKDELQYKNTSISRKAKIYTSFEEEEEDQSR